MQDHHVSDNKVEVFYLDEPVGKMPKELLKLLYKNVPEEDQNILPESDTLLKRN